MRAVVQRVSQASVAVEGTIIGEIAQGLLVLVGVQNDDIPEDAEWLAQKISKLRIFADEEGQMNRSVQDIAGGILVISQFTLIASTRNGTRPSFNDAARPDQAIPLYEHFVTRTMALSRCTVALGRFGADMQVALINDGPVTIILDSKSRL